MHPLSPEEPWSPVPAYSDFMEEDFLPENYDQWEVFNNWPQTCTSDFPSTSTIWSDEDKRSLMWDDQMLLSEGAKLLDAPLLYFITQPTTQDEDIQGIRKQVNANRRASFGGFPVTPFPTRHKISSKHPDYSVWHQLPYGGC